MALVARCVTVPRRAFSNASRRSARCATVPRRAAMNWHRQLRWCAASGAKTKNKSKTHVIWRNSMTFDVLFGNIFSSFNEIIPKICEDHPIGLSQLSEKLCGCWSWYSDENEAKDVVWCCNIMSDNWICLKFFGQTPCKPIKYVTRFC